MNILWLTWKDMKHPLAGGAEVVNEELAKRLVADGHTVHFVVGGWNGCTQEETRDGFHITRLGNRYTVYLHAIFYYFKHLKNQPFDLVIDEINTAPFFASWYVGKSKIKSQKSKEGTEAWIASSQAPRKDELRSSGQSEALSVSASNEQSSSLRGGSATKPLVASESVAKARVSSQTPDTVTQNKKPAVVLFVHQLAREIWFYQMPFPFSLVGYIGEPIYLWLLRNSEVITISESTKQDLIRYGFKPERIHIISEGIQLTPVADLSTITKYEQPTILSLGAVRAMKRTLEVVKAFEILKAQARRNALSRPASSSGQGESLSVSARPKAVAVQAENGQSSSLREPRSEASSSSVIARNGAERSDEAIQVPGSPVRLCERSEAIQAGSTLPSKGGEGTFVPNYKLIIAGDTSDSYSKKVLDYIKRSPYAADIEVLGRVSQEKKMEVMQRSHLIAVTSVKEGWGLIVTEANSQGTPACVYNVDGLRDSVKNNETGIITQENTPQSLATAFAQLLGSEASSLRGACDEAIQAGSNPPCKEEPSRSYPPCKGGQGGFVPTTNYQTLRLAAWNWSKEITFEKSYEQLKNLIAAYV